MLAANIVKPEENNHRNMMIEDILRYHEYSLCDIKEYEKLIGTPNFGYLLNAEEHTYVKILFNLLWDNLAKHNLDEGFRIYFFKSAPSPSYEYFLEIIKRKDNDSCRSILMILKKYEQGFEHNIKYIDLWNDLQIELPEGIGIIPINDFYLNLDTKTNHGTNAGLIQLEPYHIINNFLSGLAKGDFLLSFEAKK